MQLLFTVRGPKQAGDWHAVVGPGGDAVWTFCQAGDADDLAHNLNKLGLRVAWDVEKVKKELGRRGYTVQAVDHYLNDNTNTNYIRVERGGARVEVHAPTWEAILEQLPGEGK